MARPRYFNLSIANLRNRLRGFKPVLNEYFLQLIASEEDDIIRLITEDQLFDRGEDGRGISLGDYKLSTIKYKKKKNQPTNRITLKDSGKFYASLRLITTEDGFYIEPDHNKSGEKTDNFFDKRDSLKKRYPYALRLSNENLNDIIATVIKSELVRRMKSYLLNQEVPQIEKINRFKKRYG